MHLLNSTAWLYWNPPREAFIIPLLNLPVMWYGICFVAGFVLGYLLVVPLLANFLKENPYTTHRNLSLNAMSYFLADRLCWFVILGTLIGARLGAVFFYDWGYFKEHPVEIFQVWKGGLASHGGVLGIFLALFLYLLYVKKWVPALSYLRLLDCVAIPAALASCFIRLGNFMNQEILGSPSSLPWAIVFGNPIDGSPPLSRHPVQLYEALAYLATFIFLYVLWKKRGFSLSPGAYAGYLFICVFASRFFLEFWKEKLDAVMDQSTLQMGQILSIPFILLGIILVFREKKPLKTTEKYK